MAADGITVKLEGIGELRRALAALPDKLRRRALVTIMRAGGRVVLKAARAAVPVLATPNAYRTRGLLKRRLSVRVSKQDRRAGDVGVFVNVKPVKGGGAKNPLDPYYWRFVAFGTKPHDIKPKTAKALYSGARMVGADLHGGRFFKMVKHPGTQARNFLEAGAAVLPAALAEIQRAAVPAIEKLNKRGA